MNKTKIEWCDFTWNPVVGCERGCWYCYARKIAQRFPKNFPAGFKPTFHPERLLEPYDYQKPSRIFVCSNADLFAPWTESRWRFEVLKYSWLCTVPHQFLFLTKNPEFIKNIQYPERFWMGTTITNEFGENGDWVNVEHIRKVRAGVRFVSFEPLLGALPRNVSLEGIDWIIIGKLTGSKRVKLQFDWIWDIAQRAIAQGIPLFFKDNLQAEFPQFSLQQFPKPHPGEKPA